MATWQEVNGDETLALDWTIGENALVWEIGGFEGRWASQMVEKYNPMMHIFEPQQWAVEHLKTRFAGAPKVSIHPFGLWTHDTKLRLWEHDTDGASVVKNNGRTSEVCDFEDIFKYINTTDVDVCLMNIEGAEYALIPYLLGLGMMERFRYFWCQFHPETSLFSEQKEARIFNGMFATHRVMWSYLPTAVAWERR